MAVEGRDLQQQDLKGEPLAVVGVGGAHSTVEAG